MWHLWIKYIAITAFIVVDGEIMKPARAPLLPDKPFIVFWNAPTEPCQRRYQVNLELRIFNIVSNPNETFSGSTVTMFYFNHLGYYPHIDSNKNPIHGGVPQNQDLLQHLTKVQSDINGVIPMKMFNGLGIIDWEHWRPLWVRNWGDKAIYKNISFELVRRQHPQWSEDKIKRTAQEEFENAARSFMNSTLSLAKKMRPYGLWGYYLFPDCYNHNYKVDPDKYAGICPHQTYVRNDRLFWLWQQSTALYPSIYLLPELKSSPNARRFVLHRVAEALRVASNSGNNYDLPVFVYSKPVYSHTLDVLTEEDLVHTIGESATLGAAGVVLWGDSQYGRSRDICVLMKSYINGPLGFYVVNVTTAAKLCSEALCTKHGKCIRRYINSDAYLHLPSPSFKIELQVSLYGKRVRVKGKLSKEVIKKWKNIFKCQCFAGWTGFHCEIPCSHEMSNVLWDQRQL